MSNIQLDFSMFGKNANKPLSKELEAINLNEINLSINKGRNESFKKFGKKVNIVECLLTNKNGTFKVYYFKEVYDHISHIKTIQFVKNHKAISTQTDKLKYWLEYAKETKRNLKYDMDLCEDKLIIL